jgi:hypothetical protein
MDGKIQRMWNSGDACSGWQSTIRSPEIMELIYRHIWENQRISTDKSASEKSMVM